jgi:hypothetical protein
MSISRDIASRSTTTETFVVEEWHFGFGFDIDGFGTRRLLI